MVKGFGPEAAAGPAHIPEALPQELEGADEVASELSLGNAAVPKVRSVHAKRARNNS